MTWRGRPCRFRGSLCVCGFKCFALQDEFTRLQTMENISQIPENQTVRMEGEGSLLLKVRLLVQQALDLEILKWRLNAGLRKLCREVLPMEEKS